eukprot:10094319-Ditylum_brightwellii.AAC.1
MDKTRTTEVRQEDTEIANNQWYASPKVKCSMPILTLGKRRNGADWGGGHAHRRVFCPHQDTPSPTQKLLI